MGAEGGQGGDGQLKGGTSQGWGPGWPWHLELHVQVLWLPALLHKPEAEGLEVNLVLGLLDNLPEQGPRGPQVVVLVGQQVLEHHGQELGQRDHAGSSWDHLRPPIRASLGLAGSPLGKHPTSLPKAPQAHRCMSNQPLTGWLHPDSGVTTLSTA